MKKSNAIARPHFFAFLIGWIPILELRIAIKSILFSICFINPAAAQLMFPGPGSRNQSEVSTQEFFRDSVLTLRFQEGEGPKGDLGPQRSEVRIRLNLNVWVPLPNEWKLAVQAQNGSTYQGGWDTLADFTGQNPEGINFVVRRAFVEYQGLGPDRKMQIGALNVGSNWTETIPNSFDTDGWIDGFRLAARNLSRLLDQIHLTFGDLNPSGSPNFFQRGFLPDGLKFFQTKFIGEINDSLDYLIEANHLKGSAGTENFVRNRLTWDVSNPLFNQLRVEVLFDDQKAGYAGGSLGFIKRSPGKRVELGLFENQRSRSQNLIVNGFFNEPGQHVYVLLNFSVGRILNLGDLADINWITRLRKCIESEVCAEAYRVDSNMEYRFK